MESLIDKAVNIVPDQQNQTPLVEALERYQRGTPVRLHVPGHGGGRGLSPALREADLPGWDVTELEGLDDLHRPRGAIDRAQQLAAALYGARETFFLVNGTTVGLQALIAACCGEDDQLVLPRNAHRSVLGGLVLSGARPVFIQPDVLPGFGVAAGYGGDKLGQVLESHNRVAAVLAVHPCYYGVVGDLAGVAGVCRRFDVPLLVDEAHGTHFRFHPRLPRDGLSLGADAVVQSVHKTGGALTQASWLHLGTGRVDREKLASMLRLLQTSSPSYLLLASLDMARQQLALEGEHSLRQLLGVMDQVAPQLKSIPGLKVLDESVLGGGGARDYDPTRLVVSVQAWGLSGYEVSRRLVRDYGVYVEMADAGNVVAVLAPGVTHREVYALVQALAGIDRETVPGRDTNRARAAELLPALPLPPQVITPRQAWNAPKRTVPLVRARGLVCGELIAVHPPGTAIIYPGEEITPGVIEYLKQVRRWDLICHGAADPSLDTIAVVGG